ncbi:MAG TPA: ribose-5-phosphate isomerase RpiA [Thermoplasmata archaeon]|nr:ribose-5-phosphate isomerase RpiA [Thermoplasmata archaeon]
MATDPAQAGKTAAARAAVALVRPGIRLAVGSGSTTELALQRLVERFPEGQGLSIVASSVRIEEVLRGLGVTPTPLTAEATFDLMIDGADEVTPSLHLTKGGGGALFREKFLARLTRQVVIAVDDRKLVDRLGSRSPIPVEVVPFARPVLARQLRAMGYVPRLRSADGGKSGWRTDNGNEILDLAPATPLADAAKTERDLRAMPGVVETGIFVGLAHRVVVGRADGTVRELPSGQPQRPGGFGPRRA